MDDCGYDDTGSVRKIYFNIKELCLITNVSERTLYRLIKDKEFPKVKIGRRLLFNRDRVISHIENKYGRY
jgi:excisionase family DNA binding protein